MLENREELIQEIRYALQRDRTEPYIDDGYIALDIVANALREADNKNKDLLEYVNMLRDRLNYPSDELKTLGIQAECESPDHYPAMGGKNGVSIRKSGSHTHTCPDCGKVTIFDVTSMWA